MLDVGINVGMKEPADSNVGRDGAEAANDRPFANVGGSHHDGLTADDGHRFEARLEEAFAYDHARMRLGERDVEKCGSARRGEKGVSTHDTDAIHLRGGRSILNESDIGVAAMAFVYHFP